MQDNGIGLILAVAGLGMWLAFTQTASHLATNAVSKLLAWLIVPIAIAAVWRIALDLQWWTILVFILASLVVGVVNGVAMRKIGKEGVYSMQTFVGIIGAAVVSASWFVR